MTKYHCKSRRPYPLHMSPQATPCYAAQRRFMTMQSIPRDCVFNCLTDGWVLLWQEDFQPISMS